MADEPKIIVDDDWKKQAKAEKARLAEADKARAAKPASPAASAPGGAKAGAAVGDAPGAAGAQSAADGGEGEAPYKIDFTELLRMLSTQALMYLGQIPDPQTGKGIIALDMAKVHIDLLGVLEEKTRGNLTPDEDSDLKAMLGELRMVFVEISRTVAKAMAEGRIGPRGELRAPPGGAPAGPLPPSMSGPGFDPNAPGGFGVA
jgi:hypothetical protein